MRLALTLLAISLLAVPRLEAQRFRVSFVAIGPDTLTVRAWTAHWVQLTLREDAPRVAALLPDYAFLLETFLDTQDRSPEGTSPRGPSHASASTYPADLTQPLPLQDMRAVVRMSRSCSFAQTIVSIDRGRFAIRAVVVDSAALLQSTEYSARHRSLEVAARRTARQLARHWARCGRDAQTGAR